MMNKFYMELDNRDNGLSVLLIIAKIEGIQNSYTRLGNYDIPKYIDLKKLDTGSAWSIINDFPADKMDVVFIISDMQINKTLLDAAKNIADIDFKNDFYYLKSGSANTDLLEKYKMLNINVKQKSKSYELEIVESLLREHDKNNEVISSLEREKQQLQFSSSRADDDDLEIRYLDLMEKYKQSLDRLEQLRSSKLGKMQVAYWNRKRGC